MNNLFMLTIFWGVWIIIPVIFDGVFTFIYMITILLHRPSKKKHLPLDSNELPLVSVIIPAYNEADNIDECLYYLKTQSYPHELLEIIVVDNGSTDKTGNIVRNHMADNDFTGKTTLLTRADSGKAKALNAGITYSNGEFIINIDCRSFLAQDAISRTIKKFNRNPDYGALTGNIEIDWRIIHKRLQNGQIVFDINGRPVQSRLSNREKFLAKSQFMEYLGAFRLGRQFQDITNSIYTLSGAFSAFRRDCLFKSHLYSSRTVTEDTDLTLDLMGQDVRIGFCAEAKVYLKPVLSFERLYAQRVRWHRGQIEVIGLHSDWYGNFHKNFGRAFWHSVLLLVDHTFGFPRIIWTFLLPLFFLFGYSASIIVTAIFLMYVLYVFIDLMCALFCLRVVDNMTKDKIKSTLHYCIVTPIFRYITFCFRFAAYLEVLKEPQAWTVPVNPVRSAKKYQNIFSRSYQKTLGVSSRLWQLATGRGRQAYYEERIAELDSFGLGAVNGGRKLDGASSAESKDILGQEESLEFTRKMESLLSGELRE